MREIVVAAAQMGPVGRHEPRADVVERLLALLRRAHGRGAQLVVFPELALTTFFPRWDMKGDELDSFYETEMPGTATLPLFDEAANLGVGFALGFAELTPDGHRYNTMVLVERDGSIVGRFHKVHIPGHEEPEAWRPFQHLERRYFEPGPEGFDVHDAFGGRVGMAICNNRRWPESQIIAPTGEVVARCTTSGDEVVVAVCDLDRCAEITGTVFDFDRYRRPEVYGSLVERGDA